MVFLAKVSFRMKIEVISKDQRKIKFKIFDEDHTLGNILEEMLLKDKRVKGAGFTVTHPLKKAVVMNVFLKTEKNDPLTVVEENIEKLKTYLEDIRGTIKSLQKES